jgi:Sulfotransferase family
MTGRFIVTTGRCGSKLLSQLLRDHPAVLSLSGFFGTLQSPRVPAFPAGPTTGEEFWGVLSTPRPEIGSIVRQCWTAEDPEAPPGSFATPPLLTVALPHLTPEAGALHEELGGYVRTLPLADAGTQYSRVFAWLCQRFDRPLWVERSGGSTWFLPSLLRCWPDARYVHLVRDGRNAAISMSKRCGFRLAVLAADLELTAGAAADGGALAAAALAVTGSESVPLERFGEIWAQQVLATDERLRSLPADHVLLLRYEDLVEDPARELTRLAGFLDLGPAVDDWIDWSARQVERGEPAWLRLPEPDRSRLEAACRPGLRLLGYL